MDRRVEISTEHCVIDPRIQTAVVGSAVNIFNDDRLLHKLVFTRAGTGDTVAVMPFFNDGQLVASDSAGAEAGRRSKSDARSTRGCTATSSCSITRTSR